MTADAEIRPDGSRVDPTRASANRGPLLLALVGAPALWYLHFWVVYLVVEWGCGRARFGDTSFLGWMVPIVVVATGAITAAMVAVTVVAVVRARSSEPTSGRRDLMVFAVTLGSWFILAVLVVGLPALTLEVC